jgi:hypothetical protein
MPAASLRGQLQAGMQRYTRVALERLLCGPLSRDC